MAFTACGQVWRGTAFLSAAAHTNNGLRDSPTAISAAVENQVEHGRPFNEADFIDKWLRQITTTG